MGQVLYRKYRSRSFGEIIGQDHITGLLQRALDQGKVAHAYLFTGPRGVGKTSVARILAHSVNELPYGDDNGQTHLDIIEIDAASNRRIDEIRDLREKVHLAPTSAKYKVHIIDEVHMLTSEAFNALLKTLEEPPSHVIFILATTEVHKVPETIISRTQRFHFRPIDPERLAEHLGDIASKEKVSIDSEALKTLAVNARGSFRDGLSLLDQVAWHGETITQQVVEELLGLAPFDRVQALLLAVMQGNLVDTFAALERFYEDGISAGDVARSLSRAARDKYLEETSASPRLIDLAEGLIDVEESFDPRLKLETTLVRIIEGVVSASTPSVTAPEAAESAKVEEVAVSEPFVPPAPASNEAVDEEATDTSQPPTSMTRFDWSEFLAHTRQEHEPLYALLRMCQADFNATESKLTLTFRFAFHQKRASSDKNRELLEELLASQLGKTPELAFLVDKSVEPSEPEPDTKKAETVDRAADILGGDVVELQ